MATQVQPDRLSLRLPHVAGLADGAWWPQSRRLGDELAALFAAWPPEAGRISRVLYSPPDWDDRPRSVPVAQRWVKTGCFPEDDTHAITLNMGADKRLTIAVIPPDTPSWIARGRLAAMSGAAPDDSGDRSTDWENEGGHA